MSSYSSKRVKIDHNIDDININYTLNHNREKIEAVETKLNLLDAKIHQIGNMCNHLIQTSNYNKHYINEINEKMNLIHQKNESIKLDLLKEITTLQNLIIDKLMNNNFIYNLQNEKSDEQHTMPNEMQNAYS
jgi:hypothetical protein